MLPGDARPRPLTLSVVIPAYNRATLIGETLDRVLAQTRPAAAAKFEAAPAGFWSALERIDDARARIARPMVRELLAFQPFFPSCMVVDRQAFGALGGWDTGVGVGRDFATALRVVEHPPVGVLWRPVVGIRKHGGNISGDVQRMNLNDAEVLSHVLATRPTLGAYAADIRRSIAARRAAAFDTAFARGDFAAAAHIAAMLPEPPAGMRPRLKRAVIRLPAPLRRAAWRALTGGRRGAGGATAMRA